jgi:hypothetical protein
MDTNHFNADLEHEQSLARPATPDREVTPVSAAHISSQPQNGLFKPLRQLAAQLQAVDRAIVRFNRRFDQCGKLDFRETIGHYIDGWDDRIQAWKEEAAKYQNRLPQVRSWTNAI